MPRSKYLRVWRDVKLYNHTNIAIEISDNNSEVSNSIESDLYRIHVIPLPSPPRVTIATRRRDSGYWDDDKKALFHQSVLEKSEISTWSGVVQDRKKIELSWNGIWSKRIGSAAIL